MERSRAGFWLHVGSRRRTCRGAPCRSDGHSSSHGRTSFDSASRAPAGSGPLGDFPFAVSDLGRSFGHVAVGGRRAASVAWNGPAVSVSLDIQGRKRLLTKVEHHVCDVRGVAMSTTSADHWPEAAHEVPTLWFQVPPWASTVPGAVSWVVVKDDRGRPLAQNVAPLPYLNRPMRLVL